MRTDSSSTDSDTPTPPYANALAAGALLAIFLAAGTSYMGDGLVAALLSPELPADAKLAAVRAAFLSWGSLAPLAYILFVIAEVVVAPLPGLMLYAPGGVIFGGFLGGLYALIGNLVGAAIACQTMRLLGTTLFGNKIRKSLGRLEPVLEKRGIWVVFLLRVNPLTSSDLVSYAAGLTRVPTWKVVLGTALGMAPLCWLQAYLAEGLMEAFPRLLYPLSLACALYVLAVIWAIRKIGHNDEEQAT